MKHCFLPDWPGIFRSRASFLALARSAGHPRKSSGWAGAWFENVLCRITSASMFAIGMGILPAGAFARYQGECNPTTLKISHKSVDDARSRSTIEFHGVWVHGVPGKRTRQPKLRLRFKGRRIVEASDVNDLNVRNLRPVQCHWTAAPSTKAAPEWLSRTANDLVIGRITAKKPKPVSGYHHESSECTATCTLAISTMTNKLHNRFLGALVPDAPTGAASCNHHKALRALVVLI